MSNSRTIILVEDDEDDIFLIQTALQELKVAAGVEIFRNGQEAFSHLSSRPEPPALIISDLNMPVMNGFELFNALSEQGYFMNGNSQFVFLTTSEASTIPFPDAGEKRYQIHTKGFTYDQVLETVAMILNDECD